MHSHDLNAVNWYLYSCRQHFIQNSTSLPISSVAECAVYDHRVKAALPSSPHAGSSFSTAFVGLVRQLAFWFSRFGEGSGGSGGGGGGDGGGTGGGGIDGGVDGGRGGGGEFGLWLWWCWRWQRWC